MRELWRAEADHHRDRARLEAVADLARLVSYRAKGSVQRDADSLLEVVSASIVRLAAAPDQDRVVDASPSPSVVNRRGSVAGYLWFTCAAASPFAAAAIGASGSVGGFVAFVFLGLFSALGSFTIRGACGFSVAALAWSVVGPFFLLLLFLS